MTENKRYPSIKGAVMEDKKQNLQDELSDLKKELDHFQTEKERVRAIIGKIGGVPKFQTKLINVIFIVVIAASVIVSIFSGRELKLLTIEFALIALSLKIIYLIHCQMKVNHFEFWILSSLEWRLNEVMKRMKKMEKTDPGS